MTAADKRVLRERFERTRVEALHALGTFNQLCEAKEADPRKLDAAAQAMILAAAEVRIACRALTLRRGRGARTAA